MTYVASDQLADTNQRTAQPYILISADSHVGPSLERQLRRYCPSEYLSAFDDYARAAHSPSEGLNFENRFTDFATEATRRAVKRSTTCPGLQDPVEFLNDMNSEGIAASVIFAGGGNNEPIPWLGGLIEASGAMPSEYAEVGARIWNRWLVDFASINPTRMLGVAQIPMGNIDAAIVEVRWAHSHGLKVLSFPAPRSEIRPYNDPAWEPFWKAVEETGMTLATHAASGDPPYAPESFPGYFRIFGCETMWLSRRGLPHLIFGGVFERHPSLRLVFTEQRADWVRETLTLMDSVYFDPTRSDPNIIPRRPSEYWATNCYIGASFMAPYEAAVRDDVGSRNLLWGTDYPHPEGTWPRTMLALRNTFSSIPEADTRAILGTNALPVYGLDPKEMQVIADQIGPNPKSVAIPLAAQEFPEHRGWSFRELGTYA